MKKNKKVNVAVTASTQDHLEISDIRDDIVLLKNGGACAVVRTTAVNFGLLSETEQDSIIYAYAGFLNSLSFPIQIIIRSKKMDITSYVELIKQQEQKELNEAIKIQIQKYREFITSIIQENKVLDKAFYIVIPFSALELGVKGGTSSLLSGSSKKIKFSNDYVMQKAKTSLTPKRDNVIRLLSRMGLKAEALTTTELIRLFYEIYNPEEEIGQRMVTTQDYQTPLVRPVVDIAVAPVVDTPVVQPVHVQRQVPTKIARPVPVRPKYPPQRRMVSPGTVVRPNQPVAVAPQAPRPNAAGSVNMSQVQDVLNRLQTEVTKMNKGK